MLSQPAQHPAVRRWSVRLDALVALLPQNCRMKLIVLAAVLLLGLVIFLLVCFSGGNCIQGTKK
jgi:hypothetical protein